MRQKRFNRLIAIVLTLMLTLQGIVPATALAEQREVEVENHTLVTDQTTPISNVTIDGVDGPVPGSKLDDEATVTASGGATWEIPVLWVRDDLRINGGVVEDGHTYLPVLAFFVPQGYALAEGVDSVTLSDSLTSLFGTQETISVYDAATGITYILPASLRDLFARAAQEEATQSLDEVTQPSDETALALAGEQSDVQEAEATQEEGDDEIPVVGLGGGQTIVEVYCAQTARNVLSDEELQWLIELIIDYLEPQAVELLLNKFPAFREAANNGEIGKEIGLYIYYEKGDKDGKPEHEGASSALAYVSADVRNIDGALKYCYMFAVDVDDLIVKDDDDKPIRDESGLYKLARDGTAMVTLQNTIVHELFHALMHDYNRTGMAGATNLPDKVSNNGVFPTQELYDRWFTLCYPTWFKEGTASAVENVYTYRYGTFQILRRLQDASGRYGAGELNPTYEPLLLLNNYLSAEYKDGGYVFFELEWSRGGMQNNGQPIETSPSRYVTGCLATLYLSERATLYTHGYADSASAVQTVNGVTTVDSEKLRDGLNSILKWMHEGKTLDQVINMISPKDASGQPVFTDTKSFEERFIRGVKHADGKYYADDDNESLMFVNCFLNYMLTLDRPLSKDESPNGSILFDLSRRYDSPLDPNKKSTSEFLGIVESNSMVPSTVKNDTPQIGGGKSDPDQVATSAQAQQGAQSAKDDALPAAAKAEETNKNAQGANQDAADGQEAKSEKSDQAAEGSEGDAQPAPAEPAESAPVATEPAPVEAVEPAPVATEPAPAEPAPVATEPVPAEPTEPAVTTEQQAA